MEVVVESPEQLNRAERFKNKLLYNKASAYFTTKAYDFLGRDVAPNRKTRLATLGVLGGIGIAATVAEMYFNQHFGGELNAKNIAAHSGRHLFAGYVGACLAKKGGRADNLVGYLVYAEAANLGFELGQATLVTGIINHGPQNIPSFLYPSEMFGTPGNNNFNDALVAGGAGIIFASQRRLYQWHLDKSRKII